MTSNNGFRVIVIFSEIFPEESTTKIDNLFKGISRITLLKIISVLLNLKNQQFQFTDIKEFLENWFSSGNLDYAHEIQLKLNSFSTKHKAEPTITTVTTILDILEYSLVNIYEENDSLNQEEIERNLFKAILFFNEINVQKENVLSDSIPISENLKKFIYLFLIQSFSYSELVNYNIYKVFATQFIKSILFFEFVTQNPNFQDSYEAFLEKYDVKSWNEFLLRIFPILKEIIHKERISKIEITIQQGEEYEKECIFLENFALSSNIEPEYDYKNIREMPLYKITQGNYLIVFDLFIFEKIHKGIYFTFKELNNKIDDFRSFYCSEFSEKYLFYKTLQKIFGNKYIQYSGEEFRKQKTIGEPDYYIRNGNKILLFESKDVLINAKIKQTKNYESITNELKKKFYSSLNEKGKVKQKAIIQLVNSIENIINKSLHLDTNYKSQNIKIYPIIVVFDRLFSTSGLNYYINDVFKSEIEKRIDKLHFKNIKPITIIEIDTLLFYDNLLQLKKINLYDLIDGYYNFLLKNIKNESFVDEVYRKSMPFSFYIDKVCGKMKFNPFPSQFLTQGAKMFEKTPNC